MPLTVGNGTLNLTRTFDAYGEVATQSSTVNGAAVGAYTLTYNNNGQIATKSETVAGITSDYRYTYDPVGRLTQVEKDGVVVEEYGYTNGIRSSETNTLRGISRSLTYNAEDQLLTAGSTTYQYNADGFLWHKVDGGNTTTYDYSSRGELLSAALPDTRNIEYVYDALGRRIAKRVNGTTVEKYLWSGLTQLLAVYDGSDNLLMRFNYADSRTPASMMKYDAAHPTGATYYLVYDQVGSLRAVSDGAGTIVKRIDYDSFGNILTDTDPTFTVPFGFAGGLHDRDTGLVKFGFRDYDPETGRWTAKDPIGFEGGDVDVYGYVESDPVNFIDPDGEFAFLALIPLAYAAIEIGLSVSDAYSTGSTLLDPCASGGEKMSSLGLFMIGALAPGGGYSTAGKKTSKYWQYFTKGWKNFKSKWFVKGVNGKPPYKLGKEARGALNLPPKNRGTAVQPYEPRKIVGPRTPKAKPEWDWPNKGKGKEYFDGDSFPD